MPSGHFTILPISSIVVLREERQRRSLDGIDTLAESISRLGLINPITVTRDATLVAGERRLAACRSLGWDTIPVQFSDDPEKSFAVELEENIKRKDISWQEQCNAVRSYHQLRKSEAPAWTQSDTAAALGYSEPSIRELLLVAEEVRRNPELAKVPSVRTASNIARRAEDRRKTAEIAHLDPVRESPIQCADFTEWAAEYDGPPFNFIHCDFPYGIDADKMQMFDSTLRVTEGVYDDSEATYWRLCTALREALPRLMPEGHVMFWFSMHFYHETLEFFRDAITFDPFPLVWVKSDNAGVLPDPSRGPRRVYETALFGRVGDRPIVRAVGNAVALPSAKEGHMSIKPVPVLSHFFRMIVDGSTSILDPTCGSGGAIRAAKTLGAARLVGLEINPEFAQTATALYHREFSNG